MPSIPSWGLYGWAGLIVVSIAAAGWFAANRGPRARLPMAHVAGATLIALFGWEHLVDLPGSIGSYGNLTAGIADTRGLEAYQAFIAGSAVFVLAAALAVIGILRRRPWGIVLGIGLAASRVAWAVLVLLDPAANWGDMPEPMLLITNLIALRAGPAAAAIALLAWPLWRDRPASTDPVSAPAGPEPLPAP